MVAAVLAGLASLAQPTAASTLIGSTAAIATSGPLAVNGPASAVIGTGPAFEVDAAFFVAVPFLSVAIGANTVTYTVLGLSNQPNLSLGVASAITLTGLAFTGPTASITGLGVVVSGVENVSTANFAFGPESLTLNIGGDFFTSVWAPGNSITVTLRTGFSEVPTRVAAPGGLALLAPALLGLASLRRRR
jgi:hypothetical protein